MEWNNKDPFFDRDLNNFRLLFDLRALSVGIILTRCDELQEIFDRLGRGSSYGNSTNYLLEEKKKIGRSGAIRLKNMKSLGVLIKITAEQDILRENPTSSLRLVLSPHYLNPIKFYVLFLNNTTSGKANSRSR